MTTSTTTSPWEIIAASRLCERLEDAPPWIVDGGVVLTLHFYNEVRKFAQYAPRHLIKRKRGQAQVEIYSGDDQEGKPIFRYEKPSLAR